MSGTETESGNGDFPAPTEGFVLTHTIIVKDRSVSCQWYERMLDGKVVMELSETGGPASSNPPTAGSCSMLGAATRPWTSQTRR